MKVLPGIHQWLTRIIILGVIWITNGAACTTFAPVNPINTTQPPTIDIEEPNNVLPPLRITTSTEGVYGFSLTDLEDLGISPTDIDKRQLLLTFRGESIPLWLIENPEGTYWRFYSNYIDNWYTPEC